MNSLYATCTDIGLTVCFKEHLGTWREVGKDGENNKSGSVMHITVFLFLLIPTLQGTST